MFTRELVEGKVLKRIDGFQFYHTHSEHLKTMQIDFTQKPPCLRIYNRTSKTVSFTNQHVKVYKLEDLKSVTSSPQQPLTKEDYYFCFILQCKNRNLTLFCASELDRSIWIYTFEILIAMNNSNIPITKYNPFDVEQLAFSLCPERPIQTNQKDSPPELVEEPETPLKLGM